MSVPDEVPMPDLGVLPDDLADLFSAERDRVVAEPLDFAARLHARVMATAGSFPGGGGDGGSGDVAAADVAAGEVAGAAGPSAAGPSVAPAAALGAAAVLGGGAAPTTIAGLKLAFAAALFAAGGVTGVVVERVVVAPRSVEVQVAPRSSEASVPVSASPVAALEPAAEAPSPSAQVAAVADEPSARAPASSRAAPAPSASMALADRDADLDTERALLERARAALGRGDASGALEAVSQHASRFPRARMGEEREALWIQALIASGRRDEARARFERFRARNPKSFLVPALEATLGP